MRATALPHESPHSRLVEDHHAIERGDPEAQQPVGIEGERQSSAGFCKRAKINRRKIAQIEFWPDFLARNSDDRSVIGPSER